MSVIADSFCSLDLATFILPERTTVVIGGLMDLSLDKTRPPQGGLAPHLLTGATAGVVSRMMTENEESSSLMVAGDVVS
jgi:hypothetical protein